MEMIVTVTVTMKRTWAQGTLTDKVKQPLKQILCWLLLLLPVLTMFHPGCACTNGIIISYHTQAVLVHAGPPPRRDDGWSLVGDWAITTNDTQYGDSW